MKSRITIDFQGLDAGDSNNQFEPVIRAVVEDSEDVRDGLMKSFFQSLGGESNWLNVDIWSHGINGKTTYTLTPVKGGELRKLVEKIQQRFPVKAEPEKLLPSRFQIGDEVDYTTQEWANKEINYIKSIHPDQNPDTVEYTPHYSYGKVVAVKFTEGKIWYNILDDFTGKIVENIDSSFTKKFKSQVTEKE